MNKLKPYHLYTFFILLFIAFCFFVPDSGYDKYFWITWSKNIVENGLGSIYLNPEVNNFPLVLYLLKAYTLLFSAEDINTFSINYLKCFVVVFDLLCLSVVVWLLKKNSLKLLLVLVLLLNPAFWYNTIIWGQVDTFHTLFVFVSLLFAIDKKSLPSLVFIVLAINVKLQAIVFLPFILLLIFPLLKNEKTKSLYTVLIIMGLQILILFPFIISENLSQTLQSLLNSSVDFYPTLSRNAYNLWYLFFADPLTTSDQIVFLFLPLKLWGLILFVLFYVLVIFLFFKTEKKTETIFLTLTLLSLGFFFFNTQMHERYIHPVVLFSGLYAIFSKRHMIFILSSLAYLLNLEAVMQVFSYFDDEVFGFVVNYKTWFIFNPVLISLLFLASISIGIIDLRRNVNLRLSP